ncbi:hypothetical protein EAN04_24565 [Salmonella enterica]|nr:hypothetical protein [Salmonella enterica]
MATPDETLDSLAADGKLPASLPAHPDRELAESWVLEFGGKVDFYALVDAVDSTGAKYKKAEAVGFLTCTAPSISYTGRKTYSVPQLRSYAELAERQKAKDEYDRLHPKPVITQPDWNWSPLRGITAKTPAQLAWVPFDVSNTIVGTSIFDLGVPDDQIIMAVDASGNATVANNVVTAAKAGDVVVTGTIAGYPQFSASVTMTVGPWVKPADPEELRKQAIAEARRKQEEEFQKNLKENTWIPNPGDLNPPIAAHPAPRPADKVDPRGFYEKQQHEAERISQMEQEIEDLKAQLAAKP